MYDANMCTRMDGSATEQTHFSFSFEIWNERCLICDFKMPFPQKYYLLKTWRYLANPKICVGHIVKYKAALKLPVISLSQSVFLKTVQSWASPRDVVYLGWPIAPSYMSPNAGGGGSLRGLSQLVQLCTLSLYILWRSNSRFNLCSETTLRLHE